MVPEWLSRFAISGGILFLGWALFHGVQRLTISRARKLTHLLEGIHSGVPTIVYFTTPDCMACKMAQQPAIEQLKEILGGQLQVIQIDAYENPDMAKEWGVLSVPTTFILDPQGIPRQVNHGMTPARILREQIYPSERSRTVKVD
ncbi:MAG: thioredoxin family protein [Anaerolineaceae bacterium]|nr:thioredoxin family protein [Anaerolineaceae bacterium]